MTTQQDITDAVTTTPVYCTQQEYEIMKVSIFMTVFILPLVKGEINLNIIQNFASFIPYFLKAKLLV